MAKSIRRLSLLLLFAALATAGCATRQYVKRQVGTVEPQIAEIRTAQGEQAERIDAVDRRAQAGLSAANRFFDPLQIPRQLVGESVDTGRGRV